MTEALADVQGEGPAVVNAPIAPWGVRERAKLGFDTGVQVAKPQLKSL